MRKTSLAVALVAAGALVALSAPVSLASGHASSNNLGHAVHVNASHAAVSHGKSLPGFTAIAQPLGKYITKSCNIDLSALADFTDLTKIKSKTCKTKVKFSVTVDKRSVPNSWATWGAPNDTESATPNLLYSNGAQAFTVNFGKNVHWGGFEAEPDAFQVETIQVDFYTGANGTGTLVGTISRSDVDGSAGAKLFGAHSTTAFKSAVITDMSADDFAIAQIRV